MINKKEISFISFLLKQSSWVTSDNLSNHLGLSNRSISNYASRINKKYPGLILSSNKGYSTQKDKAIIILNTISDTQVPQNYEGRKKYIIEKLLLSHKPQTIELLTENFCISLPTLQNEISKLRCELKDYKLNLRIKNNKLSIIGSERKKQELVMNLIHEELEDFSFNLNKLQNLFINANLKHIKSIILSALSKFDYFLDDYSLLNYVLHIGVLIELRGGQAQASIDSNNKILRMVDVVTPHVKETIEEIYQKISQEYKIKFDLQKFFEISLPIMTNAVSAGITQLQVNQLSTLVGDQIEDLLFEIIQKVRETYSIDLAEDKFLIRFAYHIKNVVLRAKNNVSIGNSQFIKIKSEFPLIYVIAVFVSKIIKNRISKPISKDEIAYIALHIGAIMEEKKAYTEKLRCIVLAPGFNTVNRTLYKRLNANFSESIIITNFIASIDDLPNKNSFDLFISTVDINPTDIDPEIVPSYLLIDHFLSEASIRRIYQKIDEIKQYKVKQNFLRKIKFFFREDLFFFNQDFNTHIDAIEKICDQMVEKNYVNQSYKEEIYEHESIASSAYGNIAIPHPLTNNAQSSVIAISINPTPVNWSGRDVNIIFMLSLEEKNSYLFKEIFHFIIQVINDTESYNKIMNSDTYQEFLEILISFSTK